MGRKCKDKKRLRFDFLLKESHTIIEIDGIHHRQEVDKFNESSLLDVQRRDQIKNTWAKDNGYTMVRIPYEKKVKPVIRAVEELLSHG